MLHTEIDYPTPENDIYLGQKESINKEDRDDIFENSAPRQTHKQICSSTDDSIYPSIKMDQINQIFKKSCDCPSILIVDDQFINRFIIKQFWIKYNILWQEADNGKVAVDKVKAQSKNKWCKGFELKAYYLILKIFSYIRNFIFFILVK